jgi:hypothetical protein
MKFKLLSENYTYVIGTIYKKKSQLYEAGTINANIAKSIEYSDINVEYQKQSGNNII